MPRLALVDADRLDALAHADYEGGVEMLIGAMTNMMPLFNTDDRRQIVRDMRAVRSPDEFARIADAAERSLGEHAWLDIVG